MVAIINGKLIIDEEIIEGKNIFIDGDKISSISEETPLKDDYVINANGNYVSAGFIDIHTHGAIGYDFSQCDEEGVKSAVNYHLSHGTTSILPTITASKIPVTLKALENITKCIEKNSSDSNIIGVHLEGPYFSKEMCGAQNTEHITEPIKEDYIKISEKYGKYIKRWSYAPEKDKNGEFCKYISSKEIIPSAGHTNATFDDMITAIDSGCKSVTHLYSCTSTITRNKGFRILGVVETAFLRDDLFTEIIADGKHLPPELIKLIYKIKGPNMICLVTDSLSIVGTKEKSGNIGGTKYVIEDGVCKLIDRSAFAGSIATADQLLRVCVNDADIPLPIAVKMITENPANLLGLKKGKIQKDYDADLVFFDKNINVKNAFVKGRFFEF